MLPKKGAVLPVKSNNLPRPQADGYGGRATSARAIYITEVL